MASGRRDYTWGFLNEAASEGRYNQTYNQNVNITVASQALGVLYDYDVPVGYRLALNRVEVCSDSKVRHWVYLIIDGVTVFSLIFDSLYSFIVSDKNPLYIEAGHNIKVDCTNLDEIPCDFFGFITGVLEQI